MVRVVVTMDIDLDRNPTEGVRLTDDDIVEMADMIVAEGSASVGVEAEIASMRVL